MTSLDQTAIIPVITETSDHRSRDSGFDRWDNAPDTDHHRHKRTALGQLAWLLPALLTAGVGMIRPTWANLSVSELATWGAIGGSWRDLAGTLREAETPYAAVLWAWSKVAGSSDIALRLPSVLLFAAAAALVGVLGTRLVSPKVGFVAGLFFAVLPVTSRYAQDAGPLALAVFAAVLSTIFLVRLLDSPTAGPATGYAAATALLLATEIGAASVVLAHLVAVMILRRRALLPWLAAAVIAVVPAAALHFWLLHLPGRTEAVKLDQLALTLGGTVLLGGVVMGLAAVSFSTKRGTMLLSAWALLPLLCAIAVSSLTGRSILATVVVALPAWVLLAALSLQAVPTVRSAVVLILIVAAGLPAQNSLRTPAGHGQAPVQLATELTAQSQPGDAMVYGADGQEALLGRDIVARYVPAGRHPADLLVLKAPRRDGSLYAQECPAPAECLSSANRVWIIRSGSPADALAGFPAAKDGYLRTEFKVEQRWQFDGLTLILMVRNTENG